MYSTSYSNKVTSRNAVLPNFPAYYDKKSYEKDRERDLAGSGLVGSGIIFPDPTFDIEFYTFNEFSYLKVVKIFLDYIYTTYIPISLQKPV